MTRTMRVLFTGALLLAASSAVAQVGSPAGPVPVERLAARRAALFERLGDGVAVIRAAKPRSLEADYPQDSDYRESNDFFYLTGLEAPGGRLVLVARKSGPDSTILYLPEADPGRQRWTGSSLAPGADASRLSGIADVRAAPDDSTRLVSSRRSLQPVSARQLEWELAGLRQVKDADEIGRLRRAIAITAEALLEGMAAAEPGMHEYELEALIEYGFRRRGAERVGFPSIVGSGPNGTVLHYDENRRRMGAGELVVIDVGAEYGYYSADLTRTLPVSGQFTPAAAGAVRPGARSPGGGHRRGASRHRSRHAGPHREGLPAGPLGEPLRRFRLRALLHPWPVPLAGHGRPRCRVLLQRGWSPGWS